MADKNQAPEYTSYSQKQDDVDHVFKKSLGSTYDS